jgi:hypothetical protein
MSDVQTETRTERQKIVYASEGTGPLLERDYSAVIEGSGCTPEALATAVRERFVRYAPSETACFRRADDEPGPLEVGDELRIRIALLGDCRVRVVHVDSRSVTLRTLKGHPEAGRITFGASRDEKGRPVFRILSRTRAGGFTSYLGYLLLGKQMQARCWIKFIDRVVADCGGRIAGGRIVVRTRKLAEDDAGDRFGGCDSPTFACGPG